MGFEIGTGAGMIVARVAGGFPEWKMRLGWGFSCCGFAHCIVVGIDTVRHDANLSPYNRIREAAPKSEK